MGEEGGGEGGSVKEFQWGMPEATPFQTTFVKLYFVRFVVPMGISHMGNSGSLSTKVSQLKQSRVTQT